MCKPSLPPTLLRDALVEAITVLSASAAQALLREIQAKSGRFKQVVWLVVMSKQGACADVDSLLVFLIHFTLKYK